MEKKDNLIELRIDLEDLESGIDSISLVEDPAIEIDWLAFKTDKDFIVIEEKDDDEYLEKLMSLGEPESAYTDDGWIIAGIEELSYEMVNKDLFKRLKDEFTKPNSESRLDTEEYRIRFKYALSPNVKSQPSIIPTSRNFCRRMVAQNQVYRIEDMTTLTNDFGDNVIKYRGGYNCRHRWQMVKYVPEGTIINKSSINKNKVTENGFPLDLIDPEYRIPGKIQENTITDNTLDAVIKGTAAPSTKRNLGLSNISQSFKNVDEDKQILVGPAMLPDTPIYRRDFEGEYYVFFTKETIEMIAEKYMRNQYTANNDIDHNGEVAEDVFVMESWIKESENDKSKDYGFGELPIGTWFVKMKVNNDAVWKQVKEGKLNGFSVSGMFEQYGERFTKTDLFLQELWEIVKDFDGDKDC